MKENIELEIFDEMNSEEIKSLLKSNKLSWKARHWIHWILNNKSMIELAPVIGTVIVAGIIIDILHSSQNKDVNK